METETFNDVVIETTCDDVETTCDDVETTYDDTIDYDMLLSSTLDVDYTSTLTSIDYHLSRCDMFLSIVVIVLICRLFIGLGNVFEKGGTL